jgi:hypothetical protein
MNEKIKRIENYFVGMNVASGYIYITVRFPEGWKVSPKIEEKYNVKAVKTEDETGYYFFSEMSNGFDNVFASIEESIDTNLMAVIKQEMFVRKLKELQAIFEEESIDVLKTLEFKYKKKRSKKTQDDEENIGKKEEMECQ